MWGFLKVGPFWGSAGPARADLAVSRATSTGHGMRRFLDYEQEYIVRDAKHLVAQMHRSSRAKAASDQAFMVELAERAAETGQTIRTDTPENFVADLVAIGDLVEVIT